MSDEWAFTLITFSAVIVTAMVVNARVNRVLRRRSMEMHEWRSWCIRNQWCAEHDKDRAVCARWHP